MNFPKGENVVIPANDYKAISATARGALWDAKNADIPEILMHLSTLDIHLRGRLVNPPADPDDRLLTPKEVAGRYLTVEQVCERFRVMPKWLYRHKKQMPYSQPSRKVLLFPEQAVTRWFATRKVG